MEIPFQPKCLAKAMAVSGKSCVLWTGGCFGKLPPPQASWPSLACSETRFWSEFRLCQDLQRTLPFQKLRDNFSPGISFQACAAVHLWRGCGASGQICASAVCTSKAIEEDFVGDREAFEEETGACEDTLELGNWLVMWVVKQVLEKHWVSMIRMNLEMLKLILNYHPQNLWLGIKCHFLCNRRDCTGRTGWNPFRMRGLLFSPFLTDFFLSLFCLGINGWLLKECWTLTDEVSVSHALYRGRGGPVRGWKRALLIGPFAVGLSRSLCPHRPGCPPDSNDGNDKTSRWAAETAKPVDKLVYVAANLWGKKTTQDLAADRADWLRKQTSLDSGTMRHFLVSGQPLIEHGTRTNSCVGDDRTI